MINFSNLVHHPRFPEYIWMVVEQPRFETFRYVYIPETQTFGVSEDLFLLTARGFSGVYGWISGSGTPPQAHFDVMVFTEQSLKPGDILEAYICGMFKRSDGDHKFVALDLQLWSEQDSLPDLVTLKPSIYSELMKLYPEIGSDEGWFGAASAQLFLRDNLPTHD